MCICCVYRLTQQKHESDHGVGEAQPGPRGGSHECRQHDDLLLADCGVIPSHPLCGVGLTMSRLLNPVKIQEILVYEGTSMREHQS